MARNYVGNPAAANFSAPIPLIVDGEDWVDGTINMQVLQPMLDRIARLKQDQLDPGDNITFTGLDVFTNILAIKSGGHLNIDGSLSGGALLQVINGGQMTIDATSSVNIATGAAFTVNTPLLMTSGNAITRKRPRGVGDADATFQMGTFDVVVNSTQYRTANRTWTFTTPADNVPCILEIFYFVTGSAGASGQTHVPASGFGSLGSNKDLTIVAGNTSVTFDHTAAGAYHATLYYDGSDFWLGPGAGSL